MLRRFILLIATAAALTAGSAAAAGSAPVCAGTCFAAPAGSGALFVFSGHGWGHGVGMSQYGAYGYALHGATFQQILAHYYPGTTLGPAPSTQFRVLLADRKKKVTLSSDRPVRGEGRRRPDAHARRRAQSRSAPGSRVAGAVPDRAADVSPGQGRPADAQARPIAARSRSTSSTASSAPSTSSGSSRTSTASCRRRCPPPGRRRRSRHRRSRLARTRSRRGRSARRTTRTRDTRSQVYLGLSNESPATTAAVTATKGQVLFYGGTVATTFFSSTSGGKTESSLDWTGTALPYLISVPDPYDDISPYHNWGPVPVTAQTISKSLKFAGPITDATTTSRIAAGRVGKLNLMTPLTPLTVSATTLRTAIGLRSTWFTVGVHVALGSGAERAGRRTARRSRSSARCAACRASRSSSAPPAGRGSPSGPVACGAVLKLTQRADDHDRLPARDDNGRGRVRAHPRRTGDPGDDLHADADRRLRATGPPGRTGAGAAAERRRHVDDRRDAAPSTATARSRSPSRSPPAAPTACRSAPATGYVAGHDAAADRGALMRRLAAAARRRGARGRGARRCVHADRPARAEAVVPRRTTTPSTPGPSRRRRSRRSRSRSSTPGIDCSLPDFQGRIADKRSFVGGDPCVDTEGHGTFIAGDHRRATSTRRGSSGSRTRSQLLDREGRAADGTIPLDAEAAAIRWAADPARG